MRGNFQEDLLRYYQAELTVLRALGGEFAKRYPKVAARLELTGDESPDPHTERLIESFAFLTGRLRHAVDDEFPEVPAALLGVLYPHLTDPAPAATFARFEADPEQGRIIEGYTVHPGTAVFAETETGVACRFRTCAPVTLWPLEVTEAVLEPSEVYDFLNAAATATVLRLRIEAQGESGVDDLGLSSLRFHIAGERASAYRLLELVLAQADRPIVLADGDTRHPRPLPAGSIRPVGLEDEEAVLPYPPHAHPGYRLLQEYFTFPEKFLFFDVGNLDRPGAKRFFDILIPLRRAPDHHVEVDRETFLLGCTPLVNLFRRTTEPIRMDHTQHEYRLEPDLRWERYTEVHTVLSVTASADPRDATVRYAPFYSFSHEQEQSGQRAFWLARRRPATRADLPGSEITLAFLDLDLDPTLPSDMTVFAHTLCTNRDLAEQVPPGALLQVEEDIPARRIHCLRKPSPQLHAPRRGAALWKLVSHLSLNHLSLESGEQGLRALREILRLYAFADSDVVERQIMGLRAMETRPVVRRMGKDAWRGFCRGTEVTVTFDERAFVGGSAFLLGMVLNRFLAAHASVNSFTQLVILSEQREGEWMRWPAMAGDRAVL